LKSGQSARPADGAMQVIDKINGKLVFKEEDFVKIEGSI
jgi:hypothetical protein